jgi:hypothetical protein
VNGGGARLDVDDVEAGLRFQFERQLQRWHVNVWTFS